jgi:hypothetical protein
MQYYQAENAGKGFITHEDSERSHIAGYPGDIWATESNTEWATRVGAVSKTKEEAQAIVDAALVGVTYPIDGNDPQSGKQVVITLP